jgi:EmrB/QacA subfamily drug resistance transporter
MDAATVHRRRWLILAVLSLCLLVIGLDSLIIEMAIPSIQKQLGASVTDMQWTVDAYSISFGGLLLLAGGLADRFGRKLTLLLGLALFLGFSILAATSSNAGALIGFRVGMGVGASLIMPSTLSIIKYVFPPEEQARAVGIWSSAAGIGIPLGPVLGGLLLEYFWWGSIFMINIVIVGVALVSAALLIPESSVKGHPGLDVVGAGISIVGLAALIYGLIDAPNYGWGNARIIGLLIGGVAVLALFVAWELRSKRPMLPIQLFKNRRFSGAAVALVCQAFGLYGILFVLTQYFQFVRLYSPLLTGACILAICALIITSILSERVAAAIGVRYTIAAGLVIIAAGAILLSVVDASSLANMVLGLGIMGLGIGLSIAPSVDSILASAPPEKAGAASAVNDTGLQLGGAIGVAIMGSILTTSYRNSLPGFPGVSSAVQTAVHNSIGSAVSVTANLGGTTRESILRAADHAFGNGLNGAALSAAVAALLGVVLAIVIIPAWAGREAAGHEATPVESAERSQPVTSLQVGETE